MHGLEASAHGAPQCAFWVIGNPPFPPLHLWCNSRNLPIQKPFLRTTRVPLKNGHLGCFSNGNGPFYCEPVGKGEPVAQRIRENTLCPSQNGSLPVVQRRGKGHLSAATQDGLHNGTQAVVQIGGPRPCAHLPKDDKLLVPKRGPGPFSKSNVTHLQARFAICPKWVGQTCICPSVKCRTATI
jgi:hypothetical protein